MPSSQQQLHSQPGQPYTQQHVTGNTGHHVQTLAGKSTTHLAPTQKFQQQQPSVLRTESPAAVQPIVQGSLDLEHGSKSVKSENATNVAVGENKNNGAESAARRPTKLQSLGDEFMNNEHNGFVGVRKDAVQTGIVSHGADGSIRRDGNTDEAGNSHGPFVQGGKDHKASDASTNNEKGRSFQPASQHNAGALGSYVPPGMVNPSGSDKMLPQHMLNPGHKHGFSENIRPPLQQPYGLFHSGTMPFGENQIQVPISQPGGVRPGDGMIRPHVVGPLPGHHGVVLPPFDHEHLGQPHPLGKYS